MIPKATGPERPPYLPEGELGRRIDEALSRIVRPGERVLCVVPDQTRTFPLPFFFRRIAAALADRAASLDFMIALGTHPSLGRDAIDRLFGLAPGELETAFKRTRILNHAWKDESALASVGSIAAAEIEALSGGLLSLDLDVKINARVLEYDRLLVCGPVFPHEVAGFSGGNKYFFPGISGPDVIDATHWLGALVTSRETIGVKDTAVRRAIDLAASRIPVPRSALCAVVDHHGVFGLFSGSCEESWADAVALAARTHIAYLDEPVRRVVSILPEMYDELWVGAKGMYKLEPVVADGGEVVVYAPGLKEISAVHGELIRELGYHVRDYFTSRWERFKSYPWGVLAHSTHLRGSGSFDPATGIESPRIRVTLATGIPRETCEAIGLGWMDPRGAEALALVEGRDPDAMVVQRAGETLYRLSR